MLNAIKEWADERWPLSSMAHLALSEEIVGGARFAYTLGSAILVAFTIQAVTGLVQLLFYVPTTDHAYNSISFMRTRVAFGWLVHGLHYWGAQLMIVLVVLHIVRVFLWGAYKKPRELTWCAGVALLLATMGFSFSGSPLHWDQRGFWIGEVSTSIAGTVPLLGDLMKQLIRGGEEMGQLALSRLFVLHVAVLPATLAALFGIHIIAVRRFGAAGPWDARERDRKGFFWPDQVFRDAVVGTLILVILVALAAFAPPAYTGMADPLDLSYIPKPEWNFLFLYESLKYFEGPLEPIGTVGVPTVLVAILLSLPFLDRNPERNPLRRPFIMAGALALGGLIVAMSIRGYMSPGFAEAPRTVPRGASVERSTQPGASAELPPWGGAEASEPSTGPPPESSRPSAASVTSRGIAAAGFPGKSAFVIGSAERGGGAFEKNCSSCHGPLGRGGVPNPGSEEGQIPALNPIDLALFHKEPRVFAENIDRYIQHGAIPSGPSPAIRMPAFGDSNTLSFQEIANVEAYILRLNGVDRAELLNPGVKPGSFFLVLACVYGIVALALGGAWSRRMKKEREGGQ